MKVGDKVVTYDANNPLAPTSYDGNTFTFEGRQLTKIENENKSIAFEYNDQGLRIKKTVTESGTSIVTKYFYDDNKLVAEISPAHRLDFLYDENDELFGFIKDGSSKYFYVRDFLQNITGIIDSNGKFVVKYNCSAYGNVSVLQDTNGLASINPFLYKGYYFDKESGMFYCHTRYYVPEWCRWLNADHIAYIRPQNANQMNSFAYCPNDPVNKVDTLSFGLLSWSP